MTILVQSFLNSATKLSTTATTATTVAQLKTLVNAAEGVDTAIMEFYIKNDATTATVLVSGTLYSYGITTATTIYSSNTISTSTNKVDRQIAKLELAQLRRQAGGDTTATFYRINNIYDIDLLADKYTSNTTTVMTTSTLVEARPWIAGLVPSLIGWIATLSSGGDTRPSVATDSLGNVYIIGYQITGDLVMAKYNSVGAVQWQKTITNTYGGSSFGGDGGVATDSLGNVYITTICYGEVNSDILVAKYDTDGNIQWQRTLGYIPTLSNNSCGITTDTSNNVYIIGSVITPVTESLDISVAKYDTDGNIQWQKNLVRDAGGSEIGYTIATDLSNNVYISGAQQGTVLIAKYDTAGDIQWQRKLTDLNGSGGGQGSAVATDSLGNVYIIALIYDPISVIYTLAIAKYDTDGIIQWQRQLTAELTYIGWGISTDADNHIYVTGSTTSRGAGDNDILILKYDSDGAMIWQRTLGGVLSESSGGTATDLSGNVYIVGTTDTALLLAKLPGTGTGVGQYSDLTYAVSDISDTVGTLTDAIVTLTSSVSTLTNSVSTFTSSVSTLTSIVTNIYAS